MTPVYMLKLRHTGSPNRGGGEGALIGENVSFTLATAQDQTMIYQTNELGCAAANQCKRARDALRTEDIHTMDEYTADIVGALCAVDSKGASNQYVNEGKVICQIEPSCTDVDHNGYIVRRLTPTECERLQGFPDGWTAIQWRGKPAEECPDGPRYKALGNSMAVPVMRWIGERIEEAERRGNE